MGEAEAEPPACLATTGPSTPTRPQLGGDVRIVGNEVGDPRKAVVAYISFGSYHERTRTKEIAVTNVVEVRPDALASEDLEAFLRALEGPPQHAGQAARLVGADGTSIELPPSIHSLLLSAVDILKGGDGVSIIPLHAELTTVQAADILNISRPHLIKQLDAGALPHHMVGTHRRLKLLDVLAYRDRLDAEANRALDDMTADAEDLGLYE